MWRGRHFKPPLSFVVSVSKGNGFNDRPGDYLHFCVKRGEEPEKPFTGKLMLRIPPELHRKAYVVAKR